MAKTRAASEKQVATVVSLQVGLPKHLGTPGAKSPHNRPWYTGFFKEPVSAPVWLGNENLGGGDGQADRTVHGGPDKAVLVYSADHYPLWREELDLKDFPYGAFGENFTVNTLTEKNVCIGDRFAIGEATVEVSQPRQPCWKLARRWKMRRLPALVVANGRSGWYIRVLKEGNVRSGDAVKLLAQKYPQWTVQRVNECIYMPLENISALEELIGCESLSSGLRCHIDRFVNGV